jgi:molybdenum cofactor biosynthesis enzyme MoaA
VIEENQKEGYTTCIGCQLLRKKMWPYRRDLFNYLNLMHSRSCNLLCKFCGVVNFDRSPNTPTDEVFEVIQTLTAGEYLAKNANIGFSGGEPVIIDGFDRLLSYLAKGEYQISIASNGTIFSNTICDVLKAGKICNIIISVDAVSPDVYKSIKGKDYCNRVWENISRYAMVDSKKVIPKMIIMEENMNEIEQFIQKCIEYGIKNVMYDYDQNICPSQEIIDALKLFNKCCNDYGLIGLPAREGLKELL